MIYKSVQTLIHFKGNVAEFSPGEENNNNSYLQI